MTHEKLRGEVTFWDGKKGKRRTVGLNLNQSFSFVFGGGGGHEFD